ncbi:MAG: NADPH-dependent 7-cyano-7-deazaguanine reductase QueF [Chrysiogenetes bacterium]|nr:NADPH-dependent 7-cyano-7-deazaguanine reductase QueF [Chrysiogenetes bacterium]
MATKKTSKKTTKRTPGTYGKKEIEQNELEPWPNPEKKRSYLIEFTAPEFTCLCPRSGFPDFATMRISYVPKNTIVELKSLKLYLNAYRDRAISHEAAVNVILDDLVKLLKPTWIEVIGDYGVRGNIKTIVTARHGKRPAGV